VVVHHQTHRFLMGGGGSGRQTEREREKVLLLKFVKIFEFVCMYATRHLHFTVLYSTQLYG
jgi:hypothetical protein